MMESVLDFIFWFIVCWVIFNVIVGPMIRNHIDSKIDQLDREISEIKRVFKTVKIEEHSGCFYLFDNETDQFLGQGRTAEEFADRLSRDLTIKIVAGDPDVIARFRASIPNVETHTA